MSSENEEFTENQQDEPDMKMISIIGHVKEEEIPEYLGYEANALSLLAGKVELNKWLIPLAQPKNSSGVGLVPIYVDQSDNLDAN